MVEKAVLVRLSVVFQKFELEAYLLPRTGHIPQKPPKKNWDLCEEICGVAMRFCIYKGMAKKYKGKYAVRPFLLSFLLGRSNQLNSFTRILHFHCRFRRHPYRSHLWPYIHMTIRPYGQNMVIWPFDHMTKMAQIGIDMSVSWNSNKNVAFWWRN